MNIFSTVPEMKKVGIAVIIAYAPPSSLRRIISVNGSRSYSLTSFQSTISMPKMPGLFACLSMCSTVRNSYGSYIVLNSPIGSGWSVNSFGTKPIIARESPLKW